MSPRFEIGRLVTNEAGTVQGRIDRYDMAPVAPYKKEWPIVDWDGWGLTLTDPDTIKAVKSRDASPKSVTATEKTPTKEQFPMNKTINSPKTVQEFFRLANELDIDPSELMDLLKDALGDKWWEHGLGEVTFTTSHIPHGFTPSGIVSDIYVGKRLDEERWTVLSEWSAADGFSITFWTHDDDAMTADETRQYAEALMNMTAYVTRLENLKPAGGEDK